MPAGVLSLVIVDVITDFNTVGKGGLDVNNGQFTAGHIVCCHCNYILDKRPDLPLQELQSLRREPAKAPCELAKLVKHVCLEQFIGQLINSSLQPVHQYLYLIVVTVM